MNPLRPLSLLILFTSWLPAPAAVPGSPSPAPAQAPAEPLSLWFDTPGAKFTEGLPIGNGRFGATDLGGVIEEHVVLNESAVWSGSPIKLDQVDSWKHLPEISTTEDR